MLNKGKSRWIWENSCKNQHLCDIHLVASYTTKINKHAACDSIFVKRSCDSSKIEQYLYIGEDFLTKCCSIMHDISLKLTNTEDKKMLPLTLEELELWK